MPRSGIYHILDIVTLAWYNLVCSILKFETDSMNIVEVKRSIGPERNPSGTWKEGVLADRVNRLAFSYLSESTITLRGLVNQGKGRQVLGAVENRPEDDEIGIDREGEEILKRLLTNSGLQVKVFSEHSVFGSEDPEVYAALDPFDNSGEYRRGLDTSPYTVLSFFDLLGRPIAGGVGDIVRNRLFLSRGGKNYRFDLSEKVLTPIFPARTTTIKDPGFVLASYVGSNEYHTKFYQRFKRMLEEMPPKGFLHGKGGAHIYAYLASGAVGAYVMFDEPRSEIDPGLALAKAAGSQVVSVRRDGTYEDYLFKPGRQHDTVPFFIVTCTEELRDEIIAYYKHRLPQLPQSALQAS